MAGHNWRVPLKIDRDILIVLGAVVLALGLGAQLFLLSGGDDAGGSKVPRLSIPVSFDEVAGVEGVTAVTHLANAGDGSGRLFLLEQAGTVRVYVDGALLPEPFLDIRDRVQSAASEQGLLSLAFSPGFAADGVVYAYYTALDGDAVLSRFRLAEASEAVLDPASEEVVFRVEKTSEWHYGGNPFFGPDGFLYLATGDDATSRTAQDPGDLRGKLLRIDVSGGEATHEVVARGLRNPWRLSYDAASETLFIADVGHNRWEEVNAVPFGSRDLNFGWDLVEGENCNRDGCAAAGEFVPPVVAYPHASDGGVTHCAVVGGHVYRGEESPSLEGAYIFADHCSGWFFALQQTEGGEWEWGQVGEPSGTWPAYPTTFGVDEAGELYVATIDGSLYHLRADSPAR